MPTKSDEESMWIEGLVANPKKPKLNTTMKFLVDTGANCILIPKRIARKLKLKQVGIGTLTLADGKQIKCKLATAYIHIAGEHVIALVFINGNQPVIGFDIMSLLGLHIDLANRRLLRPVRLAKARIIQLSLSAEKLRQRQLRKV